MAHRTFEGSLTEKLLHTLATVKKQAATGEVVTTTSPELLQALSKEHPKLKFNPGGYASAVERVKKYGILVDSGTRSGRDKVWMIVPEPNDIVDLYKHKGDANAMADARARVASMRTGTEKAPVENVPEQIVEKAEDDDVIDSWTFGEKIIRYISILKQKLNDRDAMLRDRSEELRKAQSACKGLQDEINKKDKKLEEIKASIKNGYVAKGRLTEEQQKVKRLEGIVDDLRKNPKGQGTGFKMKDMARFK